MHRPLAATTRIPLQHLLLLHVRTWTSAYRLTSLAITRMTSSSVRTCRYFAFFTFMCCCCAHELGGWCLLFAGSRLVSFSPPRTRARAAGEAQKLLDGSGERRPDVARGGLHEHHFDDVVDSCVREKKLELYSSSRYSSAGQAGRKEATIGPHSLLRHHQATSISIRRRTRGPRSLASTTPN